jgi:hypothetical protein
MNNRNSNTLIKNGNDDNILELYQSIVDRAHQEVEGVRKIYIWLSSLLITALAIIFAFGFYYSYKSIKDFENTLMTRSESSITNNNEKYERSFTKFTSTYEKKFSVLENKLQNNTDKLNTDFTTQFTKLSNEVGKRIDIEFEDKNIKLLVENKAKQRIDDIAIPIINAKMDKDINPVLEKATSELAALREDFKSTKLTLDDMNLLSQFIITTITAQNDDRESFDLMLEWANDPNYKYRALAMSSVISIRLMYSGFMTPGFLNATWINGVNPDKLSFNELKKEYNTSESILHTSILKLISDRTDISIKEKMQFYSSILAKDKSLNATYYAGKKFNEIAKLEWKPFNVKPLLKWWEEHKNDDFK